MTVEGLILEDIYFSKHIFFENTFSRTIIISGNIFLKTLYLLKNVNFLRTFIFWEHILARKRIFRGHAFLKHIFLRTSIFEINYHFRTYIFQEFIFLKDVYFLKTYRSYILSGQTDEINDSWCFF